MASSTAPQRSGRSVEQLAGVAPLQVGQGHDFLMRRLHSLSGIVPVGAFLFEHIIISNSQAINGPLAYGNQVKFLGSMPFVLALEAFGIWIPILFHAIYGFHIWFQGESNITAYPWTGNWLYTLQRWTGGIAFAYIIWHTWSLRFTGLDLHAHPYASFGRVQAELANPWYLGFYVVGLLAASWHFAYGIWLFCAKWGIVTGENARKKLLVFSIGFFFFLGGVGSASLYKLATTTKQPVGETVTEKDVTPAEVPK